MRRLLCLLALLALPALGYAQGTVVGTTTANSGTVAAPTASTTITSSPSLSGPYRITATCFFSLGSPVAADLNNMQLNINGASVTRLLVPPALNVPVTYTFDRLLLTSNFIIITAVSNATAGVSYSCELIWSPIS